MTNQVPSFGELIELVRKAHPDIQDYDKARSHLGGLFYAIIDDKSIISVANNLRDYIKVREENGNKTELETEMANVVSLSPTIINAMKQAVQKENNNA